MKDAGIGDREGGELHAGMAREGGLEFAAERGVCGLEQHLDITALEHGADIAGAGRSAVGRDLHRQRRRRKAGRLSAAPAASGSRTKCPT